MRWTPGRLLVVVVTATVLLLVLSYGAAALWDHKKQSEKEFWDKARSGTLFRR